MKHTANVIIALLLGTLAGLWSCQMEDESEPKMQSATEAGATNKNERSANSRVGTAFREDVGSPISESTALAWIKNYASKNPDGVRSHFFGKETFEHLLTQKDVVGISIQYALNDDGVPQLLLIGVDINGNLLKGEEASGYQDASIFCPTACPH